MKYELRILLTVITAATIFLLISVPEVAAAFGWISLASGFLFMGYVVASGIGAKRFRARRSADVQAVQAHRVHVAVLTGFILLGVIGIEIAVRKLGGLWGNPWFILFHLSLVACMAVTFIAVRFVYTGFHKGGHHRVLVYSFLVFYLATLVTGSILLSEKFPMMVL